MQFLPQTQGHSTLVREPTQRHQMTNTTYVVAGNGASLAHIPVGCILASDKMVRTNNFFFEQQSYLGRRVDLAVMGGDPRVGPFMFETLWRCRNTYDLEAWTSHNPTVVRAGRRRFGALFQEMRYGSDALAEQVRDLGAQYDCKPMTGTYALLAAHGCGAGQGKGKIILAGMDLYSTDTRYAFRAGKNQSALLGQDLNQRRVDTRLHNVDLDLAIMALLQDHTGGALQRTTRGSRLDDLMDMAPDRSGAGPIITPTHPPTDWAPRAGLYPIAALKVMRRVRAALSSPSK